MRGELPGSKTKSSTASPAKKPNDSIRSKSPNSTPGVSARKRANVMVHPLRMGSNFLATIADESVGDDGSLFERDNNDLQMHI